MTADRATWIPRVTLAALACGWSVPALAQEGPPATALAVVEFTAVDAGEPPDPEAVQARLLASGNSPGGWLAAELSKTGRYQPVDPARVATALAAQGLAARDCEQVSCALTLGRTLGVDRIVTGRVSKVSNIIWFLHAVLVDVPAGRVLDVEEFEIKGNVTELLPKAIVALSRRLVSRDPPAVAAVTPTADSRAPQGERLTRDQVLAALARATPQAPADFTGKDLSGLDLSGMDFKRANLSRGRLVGTNFSKAQMFSVTLSDAVATEADFEGANLDVAVMYRVDLRRANLRGASIFAVILGGADLSDADLTGARLISPMSNATFARAKLTKANLGADPGNQSMGIMRTDATGVDFTGADLSSANLRKVLFTRADLSGADLTDADVTGADFTGAILRSIKGRDRIHGLDKALNVNQAIFKD